VKVDAFRRLAISSALGCRHVPVTGVDGAVGFEMVAFGVEGRMRDDIVKVLETIGERKVASLQDYGCG